MMTALLNRTTTFPRRRSAAFAIVVCTSVLLFSGCRKSESVETASQVPTDSTETDFISIFNGRSLEGWEGDTIYWRAENGVLIGEITPATILQRNTFIVWQGGSPADFELKVDFRISEGGNSGINYRSVAVADVPFALRGYQADIDGKKNYTGQNYEERGRTTLAYRGEAVTVYAQDNSADPASFRANVKNNAWVKREVTRSLGSGDSLRNVIKSDDWNSCHIIARGNRLQHFINGVLMSDVTDADTVNRQMTGLIGVQVHVGPPMTVEFRNFLLKQLR